ncbi:MAG: nuclear transport factor 2 family protein [bacterium]
MFLTFLKLSSVVAGYAQSSEDSLAVKSASMDYVEGWYQADAERMARSLHPDLAKRAVRKLAKSGRPVLSHLSKTTLVEYTRAGGGKDIPKEKLFYDLTILDIYKDIATVKAVSANYVDYIHLAKWHGKWMIVNILWDDR